MLTWSAARLLGLLSGWDRAVSMAWNEGEGLSRICQPPGENVVAREGGRLLRRKKKAFAF